MTGPTMVTLNASGGSVPARDVSCSKMNRCVTDQPAPPCSGGQAGAAQPRRRVSDLAAVLGLVGLLALSPGEAFGSPGYLRLSYALGDDDLVEGVSRLQKLFG